MKCPILSGEVILSANARGDGSQPAVSRAMEDSGVLINLNELLLLLIDGLLHAL